jgi:flavin reductase (DIM6/NTAB) family NADH-FMN oxidoreductase RutF
MVVGPEDFKAAVRRFASGVTIVTVTRDGEMHGMTASSFASVSLEPPSILVSLDKTSKTRTMIGETGSFAVNILAKGQEEIARAFARVGDDKFGDMARETAPGGAPLIEGALAWLECRTTQVVDGGDHEVFIAEVLATGGAAGEPLIYHDRSYRSLHDN